MIDPREFIGRPFEIGKTDCYSLLRDFYKESFDISLTDYARPSNYYDMQESLYEKYCEREGFEPFLGSYADVKYGDVFAINIDAPFINHVGVYIGSGEMLHHFWGRLSEICRFGGLWMTNTMGLYRHRDLKDFKIPATEIDALEVLPAHVRNRINAARDVPIDWSREDWRDQLKWDGNGTEEPVRPA